MAMYTNIVHVHNHCPITNFNFNGGLKTTTRTSTSRREGSSFLARNSSSAAANAPELSPSNEATNILSSSGKPEADVIVIGSGIGGLCCARLLARYEQDVLVLESDDFPGGAAHSFNIKGYKLDSGPSLFSGLQSRCLQANPLVQVLDALGEPIPCVRYDSWKVCVPEGEFLPRIGPTEFFKDLKKYVGPDAVREWRKLLDAILPMSTAAMALPPVSIRGDWGVLSTAAVRYAPIILKSFAQMGPRGALGLGATKLLRPFSEIVDSLELKDPFIRNWVDLSVLLAGVKSDGIISAKMVSLTSLYSTTYTPFSHTSSLHQITSKTNANPTIKITENKPNGVPKNVPKITIPTMRDIIASSKQQKVELRLQTLGPFFRITAKRLDSEEEIGRAEGIIRVWFGGKILHLDSIKLSRETLGMDKSIFGIGVFLGAVAIRYGYDCGCTCAELLAINDSDLYHKKLVSFYTRIGFKKVYEVTGSSFGDYSHMLVWGGVGTRMEANVEHLLVKWCARFIPKNKSQCV